MYIDKPAWVAVIFRWIGVGRRTIEMLLMRLKSGERMKLKSTMLLLGWLVSLPAWAIHYTYDDLNRLTGVTYDNGASISYSYDPAGNLTSMVKTLPAIQGVCGPAGGAMVSTAPSSNLCAVGSASPVSTSASGFTWSCAGSGGGPTAYCSAPRGYMLAASGGSGGAVTPASQYVTYNGTGIVQVTPGAGYTPTVSSTCGGNLSGTTFTSGPMTANCAVTASFSNAAVSTHYTLTVNKTGTGLGAVMSDLIGIDCGGSCSASYPSGTSVNLTATPMGASQFVDWRGACTGSSPTCSVTLNAAKSVTARFATTASTNDIGSALGNTGLFWTTGGDAPWVVDSSVFQSTPSAMRSGAIGNSQTSWLLSTLRGPAILSYDWKVSSESGYDYLRFYLDGVEQPGAISGEVNWTQAIQTIPSGPHEVAWEYSKNDTNQSGSDAGWVDSVVVLPFVDVGNTSWAASYVDGIYNAGITTGCSAGSYCPAQNVTRGQMAAFLIRAKEGDPVAGYCGATNPFVDVPVSNNFCGYIKRMKELAITTGCGSGYYCPNDSVTRQQMAAFIVRAVEGEPPVNYCGSTAPFTDVPVSNTMCRYIKRLAELQITSGTGGGNFNPNGLVTREQMAAFLARAFLGM